MGRRWLQMQLQLMQLGLGSLGILGLGWFDWSREEQQLSRPQDLTLVMSMTNSNYTVSLRELIRSFSRFGLSRHIVREGSDIQIEMTVVSSSHKGFNVNRLFPQCGAVERFKKCQPSKKAQRPTDTGQIHSSLDPKIHAECSAIKKCRFDIRNIEEPTFNWRSNHIFWVPGILLTLIITNTNRFGR
jgi:hypothetical protein